MDYRKIIMVFTYIGYLRSWECELTTNAELGIRYYGYGPNQMDSMQAAIDDYSMSARGSVSRSKSFPLD